MSVNASICIGIDLGTTYSCVGYWNNQTGSVHIIPNQSGERTTPSWVFLDPTSPEQLVGSSAKRKSRKYPQNVFFDIKRIIGQPFDSIQSELAHLPFTVVDNKHGPMIQVTYNHQQIHLSPEQISAMVLRSLKEQAENYLGTKVESAVVTVPAYFNDAQRQATKDATKIAGLNCLRIVNEPTSACLCYGLQHQESAIVLIFDTGGGTHDVSLLELNDGIFEVLATSGNTHLGGEDFDRAVVDYLSDQFTKQTGHKLSTNKAKQKLLKVAEQAKRQLSLELNTTIEVDALEAGHDFEYQLTRATFEQICHDLFEQCFEPVKKVLSDAELEPEQVDQIILVGGSTRIPQIRSMLREYFNGKPLNHSIHPDEAVAHGASIYATMLSKTDTTQKTDHLLLVDVTPLSLGIETKGGLLSNLIDRNTTIPCEHSALFSTTEDYQKSVLIQVYEGERKLTKDNHLLGTFELTNIPKAMRGVPKIKVSFKIDANGILEVIAEEQGSQITNQVTVNRESRLSEQQIEQMVAQAEQMKEQDQQLSEVIEYRNLFEKAMYSSLRQINQKSSLLNEEELSYARELIDNTIQWLSTSAKSSQTLSDLKECHLVVDQHLKPIMKQLYRHRIEPEKMND
jgi:chaperone protein DnaK